MTPLSGKRYQIFDRYQRPEEIVGMSLPFPFRFDIRHLGYNDTLISKSGLMLSVAFSVVSVVIWRGGGGGGGVLITVYMDTLRCVATDFFSCR